MQTNHPNETLLAAVAELDKRIEPRPYTGYTRRTKDNAIVCHPRGTLSLPRVPGWLGGRLPANALQAVRESVGDLFENLFHRTRRQRRQTGGAFGKCKAVIDPAPVYKQKEWMNRAR